MNAKQYNNVIDWTLKHDTAAQTEDSLATARAIFNNMGVALPNGTMQEVYETIKTDNYMGWKSCTIQEAQQAADKGTAAIGISKDRMVILSATDEEEPVTATASVMTLSESTPALAVAGLEYYAYSYLATTYNKDYCGNDVLTQTELVLLEKNKPFYITAANLYGIPWKMLAAVHYREYRLRREGPNNGNGPYQIWGSSYPVGLLTDAQFQQATNDAAAFLKGKAGNRNLSVETNVKYTLFAYNGRASVYKTQALNLGFSQAQADWGEGSPYVMNRADIIRDPTVQPTKTNRTWGQIKTDGGRLEYPANNDYGAFVVYSVI